jgi:hypothetical protein
MVHSHVLSYLCTTNLAFYVSANPTTQNLVPHGHALRAPLPVAAYRLETIPLQISCHASRNLPDEESRADVYRGRWVSLGFGISIDSDAALPLVATKQRRAKQDSQHLPLLGPAESSPRHP